MKSLLYFCCIALFLALAPLPSFYYRILRFLVTIAALLVAKHEWEKEYAVGIWLIIFVAIAVLFNPVLPVYLYNRSLWISIDILCGLIFMVKASLYSKSPKN
jgi:hypothetical protein